MVINFVFKSGKRWLTSGIEVRMRNITFGYMVRIVRLSFIGCDVLAKHYPGVQFLSQEIEFV